MPRVRVLIVDDSPTIRRLIRARLAPDPRLVVVGEAEDPYQARDLIKALNPDVLTLDVEMPRMSGLAFLEKLMRLRPMPVVMISTETHRGSAAALEALSLGAIECIGKPAGGVTPSTFAQLPELLVAASEVKFRDRERPQHYPPENGYVPNGKFLLLGSSTGGVDALETILGAFPENCPPTLITQHMPASFLASFAGRLDKRFRPRVCLGTHCAQLTPGTVYLAPGGAYHLALSQGGPLQCCLVSGDKVSGHRPSVDVLFKSAIPHAARAVAVLLTGMGRDGAEGLLRLREAGGHCAAQDKATSIVYGMPRVAKERGAAEVVLPLERVAEHVLAECGSFGQARLSGAGNAA
ncbi:chemotaxis response regulator protein-glutamate methylesterase [Pseudothioclava arenosa]|uniref:Protein-glutamate methylesterase/protein-glutamine glutaminase n=1 Tax=Pseudothioclava arenosa TaxID=1795308 RepID=A0A2A4CRL2_9RHOB|nr:chemotaxis response regulator protein-glutamate methylesterase [Pseudothioclava arenosa]